MVRKSRSSKQFALVFGALSAAVAVPRSSAWVVPLPPAAKGGVPPEEDGRPTAVDPMNNCPKRSKERSMKSFCFDIFFSMMSS